MALSLKGFDEDHSKQVADAFYRAITYANDVKNPSVA
jgi:hypothetical protein